MTRISTEPLGVTFQPLVPREETVWSGRVQKLSFSGAVVESDYLPPLGAIVELRLDVPDRPRTLTMFAEVKWHNPGSESRSSSFGTFFLMPTTGKMLDLIEMHVKSGSGS